MLTFAFMHYPYLVRILFGMPSLHLFTFLMFFKSCFYIFFGPVQWSFQEMDTGLEYAEWTLQPKGIVSICQEENFGLSTLFTFSYFGL